MCRAQRGGISWQSLQQSGVDITHEHGFDNLAMAMSPLASTHGLSLMPSRRPLRPSMKIQTEMTRLTECWRRVRENDDAFCTIAA
jgi:hypothetical protein